VAYSDAIGNDQIIVTVELKVKRNVDESKTLLCERTWSAMVSCLVKLTYM